MKKKRSKTRFQEAKVKVRGSLKIVQQNVMTGEKLIKETPNLVVNIARTQQARLLGGSGVTSRYVNRVALGTNPVEPTVDDTTITEAVYSDISTVEYPDIEHVAAAVRFTAEFGTDVGNGKTFQEAGLICADNQLFARQTFSPMTKSENWVWTIVWTIQWL